MEVGIDLSEYYINVEWDILRVPAERHVKVYACCPEPYPGRERQGVEINLIFPSHFLENFSLNFTGVVDAN